MRRRALRKRLHTVALAAVFALASPAAFAQQTGLPEASRTQEERLRAFLEQARALGVPEAQLRQWLQRAERSGRLRPKASLRAESAADSLEVFSAQKSPDTVRLASLRSWEAPSDPRTGLEYFGYRVFRGAPYPTPSTLPRGPESAYVLSSGDVLRLTLWGEVELSMDLTVDPAGRVLLPRAGPVPVAGLRMAEARERVRRALEGVYAGLRAQPPRMGVDLALLRVPPIGVFLVGEVERPGLYTLSAGSSVVHALYAAGGPSVRGTLRAVRVVREGRLVAELDLYGYLLEGRLEPDVRLQDGDVVFVGLRRSTVAVEGAVRRPGLYEVLPAERLSALLQMAGGLLPEAYAKRAYLERTLSGEPEPVRRALEVPLERVLSGLEDMELADGDRVLVLRRGDEVENTVIATGAIHRPARLALGPGMRTLRDLVLAVGLRSDAYRKRAHLYRWQPQQSDRELVPVCLDSLAVLEGLKLRARDSLRVFSLAEVADTVGVRIMGAVRRPGQYRWYPGMRVEDLLLLAGGLLPGAAPGRVEIARTLRSPSDERARRMASVADGLWGPVLGDTVRFQAGVEEPLSPLDLVAVPYGAAYRPLGRVYVGGRVRYPGYYVIEPGLEEAAELIERAGGLRPDAYEPGVRLYRNGLPVVLGAQGSAWGSVRLMHGDSIYVPARAQVVAVLGHVGHPGWYPFEPGKRVSHYVRQAGGLRPGAEAVYLITPEGRAYRVLRAGLWGRHPDPIVEDGATVRVDALPEGVRPASFAEMLSLVGQAVAMLASLGTAVVLLIR